MWKSTGNNISMAEGDFGKPLPFDVCGETLQAEDTLRFTFKNFVNGSTILEKEYTPENDAVALVFTEAESELFPVGNYVYRLDWYQNGEFMYNLIPVSVFKVVDKA